MGLQNISKSWAVHGGHILFVGEEFYAACFEKWHFWRQAPGGFILARQLAGFDLAGLDVGLVESIDADDGACNSRSDFPTEKFLAKIVGVRQSDANDGLSSLFEGGNRSILGLVGLRRQAQISEHAIVAIGSWLGETLAIHGDDAFANFSGGFGN